MPLLIKCSSPFVASRHPHLRAPPHVCCYVCHAHARPCLSTVWALNRRFDLTFGTAAVLAQGGGVHEKSTRELHQNKVHVTYAKNKTECPQSFFVLRGLCGHFKSSLLWGCKDGTSFEPLGFTPPLGRGARREVLCSHFVHITCGPPRRQGLCSRFAHMWAPGTGGVKKPLLILRPRTILLPPLPWS